MIEYDYLEPPDVDDILSYEDWWFSLEDIAYNARMDERIDTNGSVDRL